MKAKIKYDKMWKEYWWEIYYNNGALAAEGRDYTRRDNAKRGLKRFLRVLDSVQNLYGEL